jgi:BNR repeat-like domain
MQNLFIFLILYFFSLLTIWSPPVKMTICSPSTENEIIKELGYLNQNPILETDTAMTYAAPTLQFTPEGSLMLIWSEKNTQGQTALCFSISTDKGNTFGEKKTVAQNTGLGNGRFAKAKILFKKNGDMVAVYSQRFENPPVGKSASRGPAGIVSSISKDKGNTWSPAVFVDTDPSTKLLRGFFDATIMANEELAIVYLKDVAGSTKHEERDLRLTISKDGVFQPEVVLDAIACDCCPVNISVNNKGELQVIYRDNNDDIRDMAILTSNNNAKTFSASRILSVDNWKIAGCPHSGAVTFHGEKTSFSAWQAGSDKEPGLRLVNAAGKKLFINADASAKNPTLAGNLKTQVLAWEQNSDNVSKVAYKTINEGKVSETSWLAKSENATGVNSLIIGRSLVFAYEVKMPNKKNQLRVEKVNF